MEPRCGPGTRIAISEVLPYLFALLLLIIAGIEAIVAVWGGLSEAGLGVVLFVVFGVGFTLTTVLVVIAAVVGAATAVSIVGAFYFDRCGPVVQVPIVGLGQFGVRECMSGIVGAVFDATESILMILAPYALMHDRVDLITKSKYWQFVESGNVFVHCTSSLPPRRAEIIRCYFFSAEVCNAGLGAFIGVIIGAIVGVIAAIIIVLAILFIIGGCSTGVLCVLGVIAAAALIAFAIAMVAATVGGIIGAFSSPTSSPTPTAVDTDADGIADTTPAAPAPIAVGDFLTVTGMVYPRDSDDGANVFWRIGATGEPPAEASSAVQHGNVSAGLTTPFSHLDIDDDTVFPDACPI